MSARADNMTKDELAHLNKSELFEMYIEKESINTNFGDTQVPPYMNELYRKSEEQFDKMSVMVTFPHNGHFLGFLVGHQRAKRILEIGTFVGGSALYFANALKRNGVDPTGTGTDKAIVSLEVSSENADIAKENFNSAGVSDYVEIIVGDARENIRNLEGQKFDIVLIDADKESYKAYYDSVLELELLEDNGLLVVDNTAFDFVTPFICTTAPVGDQKPINEVESRFGPWSELKDVGMSLHEFNEYVRADPRTEVVMLPFETGVSLIRLIK